MDTFHVTQPVLRGSIGQDRMDKGTGALPAPDNGKMPYILAQGRLRVCSRNQHT